MKVYDYFNYREEMGVNRRHDKTSSDLSFKNDR